MKDRMRTLNVMLVVLVFNILLVSGLMTGLSYFVLFRFGMVPRFYPQVMTPLLILSMCLLIGTVTSAGVSRRVLRPINDLVKATKKVAQGDFSVRVEGGDFRGEIQELVDSFNEMTEELKGIEMFRSDFINSFSHEFKTPIVSIRGFARQLQRDDLTPQERREYAQIIASESERLANMASNVLLLTKLENQNIVTDQKEFRLDEQIRSCVLLLEKQWSEKDITPSLDLEEISITANEEMLSHIWINLIGNAVKFSSPGSEIRLRLRAFGTMVLCDVEDDGEGMDEETKRHIFEKFYQGDSAHATEGNGLGLSLVGRIVKLSGGDVSVRSAPGQGSCFTVKLPYFPPIPTTAPDSPLRQESLPKSTT